MFLKKYIFFYVVFSFLFLGCSTLLEAPRTIWGSSIRALDDARVEALVRSYECSFDGCFDVVLSLARAKEARKKRADLETEEQSQENTFSINSAELSDHSFDVFMRNRIRGFIVVMGIQGNIDTTEVGIFFTPLGKEIYKVEISSLSSTAKEKVAKVVFDALDQKFPSKR